MTNLNQYPDWWKTRSICLSLPNPGTCLPSFLEVTKTDMKKAINSFYSPSLAWHTLRLPLAALPRASCFAASLSLFLQSVIPSIRSSSYRITVDCLLSFTSQMCYLFNIRNVAFAFCCFFPLSLFYVVNKRHLERSTQIHKNA